MKRTDQSTFRRFFASRLFLIVGLLVVALIAIGYARAYYQDYQVRQQIDALQEQLKVLDKKKLESIEIFKYVTSPKFVEEKARTELNMQKPGEQVVVIKNQEPVVISNTSTVAVDDGVLSNPLKWWYYFTHKQLPNIN